MAVLMAVSTVALLEHRPTGKGSRGSHTSYHVDSGANKRENDRHDQLDADRPFR